MQKEKKEKMKKDYIKKRFPPSSRKEQTNSATYQLL